MAPFDRTRFYGLFENGDFQYANYLTVDQQKSMVRLYLNLDVDI
jgi:hypothetical protein